MTFEFSRNIGSPQAVPMEYALSGEALTMGDAVVFTSGELVKATATSAVIAGIAAESVADATICSFYPALPGVIFKGQCTSVLAATELMGTSDIEIVSDEFQINEDAHSVNPLRILNLADGEALGDGAIVEFTFVLTAW